jgi:hypothetical protein
MRFAGLLAVVAVAVALAAGASRGGTSPVCRRGLTTVERDPRGLLLLTANAVGPASAAAFRFARPASRPLVVAAARATDDRARGHEARYSCGTRVWLRTVVVYVRARAMLPSQSLSQGVYFVGRFRDGYHVWQVVH